MTIKPILLCGVLTTFILSFLVAEDKPVPALNPDLKEAHKIIDKMVEAVGGEEAIKKIKSRVVSGEMSMPAQGITVKMDVSQKAPNKVLVRQEVGPMKMTQGFDGEKGWSEDPLQGSREIEGDELQQLKRESNITREISMKEEYPSMKLLPEEKDGERTLQVIEATSIDDRTETWYFDAETGLPAKMKQKMSLGPEGEIDVTFILKDYREVDGIKIAFVTELQNPAFNGVLKLTEVKHDVELDDKIFEAPSDEE